MHVDKQVDLLLIFADFLTYNSVPVGHKNNIETFSTKLMWNLF